MTYENENRGSIQYRDRARQIIDFSGIRYGNITPTDIDGFFEKADKGFIFYEFKLTGVEMPRGQELAYTRLVDALQTAGKKTVFFLCIHNVQNPEDDILADETIVEKFYYQHKWYPGENRTLKRWTDIFMNKLQ